MLQSETGTWEVFRVISLPRVAFSLGPRNLGSLPSCGLEFYCMGHQVNSWLQARLAPSPIAI
jgi:hypothetical protein